MSNHRFFSSPWRMFVAALAMTITGAAASATAEVTGEQVRRTAESLGFSPTSLTIAGLTQSAEVEALLQRIADASSAIDALDQARTNLDQAGAELTSLKAIIAATPDDTEVMQAYQNALAAYDNAAATLDQARDDLRGHAVDGMSQSAIDSLDIWLTTSGYNVAAAFRVDARSDEQWRAIESALRAEKRAERLNQPLDTNHADLLNQVRSEVAVITAKNDLTAHLATVTQAFDNFNPEL
jgi:tetratricopeptide (TPR) repeat protein